MKVSSPRTWLAVAAVAAITGLSLNAVAQNTPAAATPRTEATAQVAPQAPQAAQPGERMERWAKRHAERRAQHLDRLKAELKLSPEQEPAWLAFVARTQPTPKPLAQAADKPWDQLTTPERIERFKTHQAERQAAMNQRLDAVQGFYAALTPEQQKVFDARSPLRGPGMDRHGKGDRHGHHPFHGHHGAQDPKNAPQAPRQ